MNAGWAALIGACAFALACEPGARDFNSRPSSRIGSAGAGGSSGAAAGVAAGNKSGGTSNTGVPGGGSGAFAANGGGSSAGFGQAGPNDGARCGDHLIQAGEACDDGPQNSDSQPNACRTNCQKARCGDGTIDTGEACDEGLSNSDSVPNACRSNCTAHRCGDSVKDAGEACDNGPANNDTTPGACATTCHLASCGNGTTDVGEECDKGGSNSDSMANACRTSCQKAKCGDGVLDSGEACDKGAQNSSTQANGCRTDCQPAHCGDRVVDSSEACDDGMNDGKYGGCNGDCKSLAGRCGDAKVQTDAGEACDDGKNDGKYGGCNGDCKAKAQRCGDGQIQSGSGEVCDDGKNDGAYGGCNADCKSKAPYCGDGQAQSSNGEGCEPPNSGTCDARCKVIPPSCVPSGSEQCFNGIDDDCSGKTDCADPACNSTATCAPSSSHIGALVPLSSACPTGFTNGGTLTLHQNPDKGKCTGCGCSPGTTECRATITMFTSEADCKASKNGVTAVASSTSCPAAPQREGSWDGFQTSAFTVTPGTCTASGSASLTPPTWTKDMRLCLTTTVGAGCQSGFSCVPAAPSGTNLCSEKSGSSSCQTGFSEQIFYDGFQDSRNCSSCSCSRSGGDCNSVKIGLGSDWSCVDTKLEPGKQGEDYCGLSSYSPPIRLVGASTPPTCTAQSTVGGSLTATGAHGLCCK